MKNKQGKQKTKLINPDVHIINQTNAHPSLKLKKMGNKTNWLMTAARAVALVLGVLFIGNAVGKELPKKEVIETVKKLEMITFEYVAPLESYPYDDEHIFNPENWIAVQTPSCSTALLPNTPCSIQVEKTNTVGGAGNEIDLSLVTLKLTSVGTQRYIIDTPSSGDNYTNPINTQKP